MHALLSAQIDRICAFYEHTDNDIRRRGRAWYRNEHRDARDLAELSGYPVKHVCACLAILSPRCRWPRVKDACRLLLLGQTPRGIFTHNRVKAERVLTAGPDHLINGVGAPKTWAFWQNLWRPSDPDPVTLDAWMFRAHGMSPRTGVRAYQALAAAYRVAAHELHVIPNQLQATIWLAVKASPRGRWPADGHVSEDP